MINQRQAQILAAMLHEFRPGWGIDATLKVLERNADHPASFMDIATASISAARDPETKTPGRVFQVSQHWPEAIKPKLPKPDPCPDHEWEPAHHCRACMADVLAGDREPHTVGTGSRKPRQKQPPPNGWRPARTEPRQIPQPRPTPET